MKYRRKRAYTNSAQVLQNPIRPPIRAVAIRKKMTIGKYGALNKESSDLAKDIFYKKNTFTVLHANNCIKEPTGGSMQGLTYPNPAVGHPVRKMELHLVLPSYVFQTRPYEPRIATPFA